MISPFLKVLIVEDSLFAAMLYEQQIHRKEPNFEVRVKDDLTKGIKEAQEFLPNIVILDIGEALKCGTMGEGIGQFKALGCKVIGATADPHITEEEVLEAGADAFMPKLVTDRSKQLFERIHALC